MESVQAIKQRFGIIGNAPLLNRALEIAIQVAATDISVLVTGESGTGKENIPKVIHQLSPRKHKEFIAVNCGAIPEGTIDSELFGHEKGSFTGATGDRKGYFEVADGGTIFLDEVAELPMSTQVRLLRVLETGEFIRVGSSKIQKTNVRVVAATNENMQKAIEKGKFREDLFYRLSTIQAKLPPLRERGEDIYLLFRKFASDFAEKYKMPAIKVDDKALDYLMKYPWPGNIRQLRNLVEQMSVLVQDRLITEDTLQFYLPPIEAKTSGLIKTVSQEESLSERDLMYKFLYDVKRDLTDLKKLVLELISSGNANNSQPELNELMKQLFKDVDNTPATELTNLLPVSPKETSVVPPNPNLYSFNNEEEEVEEYETVEEEPETLSLGEQEKELIRKALEKYNGRRKNAAKELGISERTLYRKIKEYNLTDL